MEVKPFYKPVEIDYDRTLIALSAVDDYCIIPRSDNDISSIRVQVNKRFPGCFSVNKTINGARITRKRIEPEAATQ